jgi:hypothetical protein
LIKVISSTLLVEVWQHGKKKNNSFRRVTNEERHVAVAIGGP